MLAESTTPLTLYDRDWEDVNLRIIAVDGNRTVTRDIRLQRHELEQEEKDMLLAQAETDEEREQAEVYTLPQEVFKRRVVTLAQEVFSRPMYLPIEGSSNVLNILSPSSVRKVQITVHNVGKILLA
jgi:hypothetical protein